MTVGRSVRKGRTSVLGAGVVVVPAGAAGHSHSIVPGGFEVMS